MRRTTSLRPRLVIGGSLATLALVLAAASPAAATPLFASPTGDDMGGTNLCTSAAAPCTIVRAVEVVGAGGDDVTLAGGTYIITSSLDVPDKTPDLTVHGSPGARPTIAANAAMPVAVSVGGVLRDINVVDTSAGIPELLSVESTDDLAERIYAHSTQGRACEIGGTLRDSVCWSEAVGGIPGLRTSAGGASTVTATLRNVTAVNLATGGIGVEASSGGAGASASITASNVIAQGASADVKAAVSGSVASATLDHSNYDTRQEFGGTVTDPMTMSNVMTPPVFVDAPTGDFHQTAASAGTIDLGTAMGPLGTLDLDGDGRALDASFDCTFVQRPDIGADEFAGTAQGTPAGCSPAVTPPQTSGTPLATGNPECTILRAKLKRAKTKRNRRKIRRRMRALGC